MLSTTPPDVLISDVRLREFNGLHLALCARDDRVKGTIVMATPADVLLADEAARLGAVFLVKPVDLAEVCQHVSMILEPQPDTGFTLPESAYRFAGARASPPGRTTACAQVDF